MNQDEALLKGKLARIEGGARWFRVLSIVLVVLGCVAAGGGGLQLLGVLGAEATIDEVLARVWSTVSDAILYFVLAWLAGRAADAFISIAALIREIGEIV